MRLEPADHGGAKEVTDLGCLLPKVCCRLPTSCHRCEPNCPSCFPKQDMDILERPPWNEGARSFTRSLEIKPEVRFWVCKHCAKSMIRGFLISLEPRQQWWKVPHVSPPCMIYYGCLAISQDSARVPANGRLLPTDCCQAQDQKGSLELFSI